MAKLIRFSRFQNNNEIPDYVVTASSFMAFHTILKTSEDYYEALRWARKLTDNLTMTMNEGRNEKDVIKLAFIFHIFRFRATLFYGFAACQCFPVCHILRILRTISDNVG